MSSQPFSGLVASSSAKSHSGPTLLEYLKERLLTLEEHITNRLLSQQKVIDKVEDAFHRSLEDTRREMQTFCNKAYVEQLEKRLRELENAKNNLAGRLAVVGSLWTIVMVVLNYVVRTNWG